MITKETVKDWPANLLMQELTRSYKLYDQEANETGNSGFFHHCHEIFFEISTSCQVRGYDSKEIIKNCVWWKSAWIPTHKRTKGLFVEHLQIITDLADMFNVAILCCSNPFDLVQTDETTTPEELESIFRNGIGFHYVANYEASKLRQRDRLRSAGYVSKSYGRILDRDRISKRDQLIYIPENLTPKLKRYLACLG